MRIRDSRVKAALMHELQFDVDNFPLVGRRTVKIILPLLYVAFLVLRERIGLGEDLSLFGFNFSLAVLPDWSV